VAVAGGWLGSVDDPATKYIPEMKDPRFKRVTVRNLLWPQSEKFLLEQNEKFLLTAGRLGGCKRRDCCWESGTGSV
jgi:hypothetical protein